MNNKEMNNKEMKEEIKNQVKLLSPQLDDYQKQLQILVEAQDRVMVECGLIYPAVHHLHQAIKETLDYLKTEALKVVDVDDTTMKIFKNSSTNYQWDWYEDFQEWRKEKKDVINRNRKNN